MIIRISLADMVLLMRYFVYNERYIARIDAILEKYGLNETDVCKILENVKNCSIVCLDEYKKVEEVIT